MLYLPAGYRFSAVHCGIRPDREKLDLALVVSDTPASCAGVFTQNQVQAAPVQVCRERLPQGDARGLVVCSGNANACTGEEGLANARRMTELAARELGCRPEQILVSSTGVIGKQLSMVQVENGIAEAVTELASTPPAFENAARAILTTDTRIKTSSRCVTLDDVEVRMAGFAKGAAMIGPNMATLLAFVLTDARVASGDLHLICRRAADRSFHCISVEGDTSTNDTLLFFANGTGKQVTGTTLAGFEELATSVCQDLAKAIVEDAEGAQHLVKISVDGLRTSEEARRLARTVAESPLVKTAIFGGDPNWGRILMAAGRSGINFQEKNLLLWLGDMLLYREGAPQPFDVTAASVYLKMNREVHIRLHFNLGPGECTFWTCDLTYDYVRLNAEYTT
jgi:glutamate N-acetyltransferase/amino-acid N-acetyltransferase